MMDYLEGPNSAHSRYYPDEWDYRFCGRHMKGESPISQKRQSRKELFAQVCSKYSPSFRFFFMEYFLHSAEAWHSAKMKYTRSVAINSIVGHVLGIGDRHLSNILIHTKTGAVVHIDFGIVFEQGKVRVKYPFNSLSLSMRTLTQLVRPLALGCTRTGSFSSNSKCR